MGWETGVGFRLAATIGICVVTALLVAAAKGWMADFIRDYQILIAALVAMGAAFIAYDGTTASARESKRKDDIERSVKSTYLAKEIFDDIEQAIKTRIDLEIESLKIDPNGEYAIYELKGLYSSAEKFNLPSISQAMKSLGDYDQPLRPILFNIHQMIVDLQIHSKSRREFWGQPFIAPFFKETGPHECAQMRDYIRALNKLISELSDILALRLHKFGMPVYYSEPLHTIDKWKQTHSQRSADHT